MFKFCFLHEMFETLEYALISGNGLANCTKHTQVSSFFSKVLFTNSCRWQNFRPSLLRLEYRLYTVIHKTQQTRTKVFPSVTVSEQSFIMIIFTNWGYYRKVPNFSKSTRLSEMNVSKCCKKICHNPVYFPCLKGKSSRQATKGKSSSKAYQYVIMENLKLHYGLVLGLVILIDAKGIDLAQPISS